MGKTIKQSTDTNNWGWFQQLQAEYSVPFNRLSPQQCRTLYVGERMSTQAVSGPTAEAAAVVMGNSEESEYDL